MSVNWLTRTNSITQPTNGVNTITTDSDTSLSNKTHMVATSVTTKEANSLAKALQQSPEIHEADFIDFWTHGAADNHNAEENLDVILSSLAVTHDDERTAASSDNEEPPAKKARTDANNVQKPSHSTSSATSYDQNMVANSQQHTANNLQQQQRNSQSPDNTNDCNQGTGITNSGTSSNSAHNQKKKSNANLSTQQSHSTVKTVMDEANSIQCIDLTELAEDDITEESLAQMFFSSANPQNGNNKQESNASATQPTPPTVIDSLQLRRKSMRANHQQSSGIAANAHKHTENATSVNSTHFTITTNPYLVCVGANTNLCNYTIATYLKYYMCLGKEKEASLLEKLNTSIRKIFDVLPNLTEELRNSDDAQAINNFLSNLLKVITIHRGNIYHQKYSKKSKKHLNISTTAEKQCVIMTLMFAVYKKEDVDLDGKAQVVSNAWKSTFLNYNKSINMLNNKNYIRRFKRAILNMYLAVRESVGESGYKYEYRRKIIERDYWLLYNKYCVLNTSLTVENFQDQEDWEEYNALPNPPRLVDISLPGGFLAFAESLLPYAKKYIQYEEEKNDKNDHIFSQYLAEVVLRMLNEHFIDKKLTKFRNTYSPPTPYCNEDEDVVRLWSLPTTNEDEDVICLGSFTTTNNDKSSQSSYNEHCPNSAYQHDHGFYFSANCDDDVLPNTQAIALTASTNAVSHQDQGMMLVSKYILKIITSSKERQLHMNQITSAQKCDASLHSRVGKYAQTNKFLVVVYCKYVLGVYPPNEQIRELYNTLPEMPEHLQYSSNKTKIEKFFKNVEDAIKKEHDGTIAQSQSTVLSRRKRAIMILIAIAALKTPENVVSNCWEEVISKYFKSSVMHNDILSILTCSILNFEAEAYEHSMIHIEELYPELYYKYHKQNKCEEYTNNRIQSKLLAMLPDIDPLLEDISPSGIVSAHRAALLNYAKGLPNNTTTDYEAQVWRLAFEIAYLLREQILKIVVTNVVSEYNKHNIKREEEEKEIQRLRGLEKDEQDVITIIID